MIWAYIIVASVSFLLGMLLMAYLLLSKNVIFRSVIELFSSEEYIDEIRK